MICVASWDIPSPIFLKSRRKKRKPLYLDRRLQLPSLYLRPIAALRLPKDVAASVRRTADGEAVTKHARQARNSHSTSIRPQGVLFTTIIFQKISKK